MNHISALLLKKKKDQTCWSYSSTSIAVNPEASLLTSTCTLHTSREFHSSVDKCKIAEMRGTLISTFSSQFEGLHGWKLKCLLLIEGSMLTSMSSLPQPQLSVYHHMVHCWLVECTMISVWFQRSNECHWPHLIAAGISNHWWICASLIINEQVPLFILMVFVLNPPVCLSVYML